MMLSFTLSMEDNSTSRGIISAYNHETSDLSPYLEVVFFAKTAQALETVYWEVITQLKGQGIHYVLNPTLEGIK
ncbi:hypothetical protein [Algivirga pacifica]|uniref:Uncharacterized protein n=1 Tax=Algivirga pacifica TaxID=1162670 RepID=A0ABP9CWR2_9BACT